jgi:hypothetical protein
MTAPFDAKTYIPKSASSALVGAIMVHHLDLARFENLLTLFELTSLHQRAEALAAARGGTAYPGPHATPDDASWWRWLVLDACVDKYGSGGAVLEAIGGV